MMVDIHCKIGDEVWGLRKFNGVLVARKGIVSQMYFLDDMRLAIVVKGVSRGEWGISVFATEKEALDKISEKCYN